jgi:putative ABC transport system permease protein
MAADVGVGKSLVTNRAREVSNIVMYGTLIISGLIARPVRTAVSVMAVALEVILILTIIGLANGITTETGKRTEGVGADIMFQAPNSSLLLAMNNSSLPVALTGKILEIEGVKTVAPVQVQVNSSSGLEIIYGIERDSFDQITGGFTWRRGRNFSASDEIVIDDIYAASKGLKPGDSLQLLNHNFKIVGVVEHGKGARLYIPFKTAQEMAGSVNRASLFYIKLNDPHQLDQVVERMKKAFPGYKILPMKEYTTLMMSNYMSAFDAFIHVVVLVAVFIGVLVIFLSMYTTITERTREIGIFRSLGAPTSFIVGLIFEETALVCLVGVTIGVASSFLIAHGVTMMFPTLQVMITTPWVVKASISAMLSGLIGSLYPALRAAAQDPVEAFAYE